MIEESFDQIDAQTFFEPVLDETISDDEWEERAEAITRSLETFVEDEDVVWSADARNYFYARIEVLRDAIDRQEWFEGALRIFEEMEDESSVIRFPGYGEEDEDDKEELEFL